MSEDVSRLFTRKASGLVRVAGGFDTFIFSIGLIGVGGGIFTGFFYRAFYPGSDFFVATLIAGIGGFFVALAFYCWSVIFPRSGGDFVFLSRSTSPGVAFTVTFFEAIAFSFLGAVNSYFFVQVGLSPLFATFGIITKVEWFNSTATWLASQNGTFLIAGLVLLVTGLVPVFGMRRFLSVQKIMFVIAMVGVIVGLGVLLFGSQAGFDERFTSATGLSRDGVMTAAKSAGLALNAPFSWGDTFKLLVWPAAFLPAAVMSSAIGGEIKAVRRSQFIGMVGSVIVATVFILAYIPLADNVIGRGFQDALVWNFTEAPKFSTSAPPFITLLLGIASPNIVIASVVIVGFMAWNYFLISPQLMFAQRLMIAWSFDRIAPDNLGYVSERFKSPVVAIWISLIVAMVFVWFIAYGILAVLALILGIYSAWAVICLLGVWFPRLRPTLYGDSAISRYRIFGLPAMSVVSVPAAAFMALVVYLLWQDPLAAGHSTATLVAHGVIFASGVVLYLVARSVRRSQGVEFDQIFKVLPIE
jgi:amino acid transporter